MKGILRTIGALLLLAGQPMQAELVAHWPLDSNARDLIGNHHGQDSAVTFGADGAAGHTGTAAEFNGSNSTITVPFDEALNPESFTLSMWVNADSTGGFASPVTSRDDVSGGVSTHGYILYNDNRGNWNFWTGDGNPGWDTLRGPAVSTNTWTHLALTFDAATGTKSLFVDGALAATETAAAQYSPNGTVEAENFHIGSGGDAGNSFFFDGLIDDVGVWDEALDQAVIQNIIANGIAGGLPDPALVADNVVEVTLDGTVQSFDIPVTNNGQSEDLVISAASFDVDSNFAVTTIPGAIAPGTTENIVISFDPAGGNGVFEGTLALTSNDELVPEKSITVRGVIRDPMLVSDASLDLGETTSGTLTITNIGTSRPLNISALNFSGADADKFEASGPTSIAAGGETELVNITFNSQGEEGTFFATLEIVSDDPLVPVTFVELSAIVPFGDTLVAWWPLDVDGSDASGNGFDGTISGVLTPSEGANAATGGSLNFDGGSRIDVPFDPDLNPQDFTITLWANAASTGGFASPITSRDDVNAGVSTHGYILYNDNGGNWNFWTGDGNPGWDTLPGGAVLTNTWTHIAMSYDSLTETKSIYLDGVLAASESAPNQYSPNGTVETENLHIGSGQDDGNNFWFAGSIDDVGLFRVALTEEEINTIITSGVAGFTGAARDLVITDLAFGPNDGEVTITFDSVDNANYLIERSNDLVTWEELTDNHASQGETTTFTDFSLPAATRQIFYRVSRP